MKKIIISIIITILLITGCTINTTKRKDNKYKCSFTSNKKGIQELTEFIIELNKKDEAITYTIKGGYKNFKDNKAEYDNRCNTLKSNLDNENVDKYQNKVEIKVICNSKNNYQTYIKKTYKVKEIKDIPELKNINNYIELYTNKDKTFNLKKWKTSFYIDNNINYKCNF